MNDINIAAWSARAYEVVQLIVEIIGPRGSTSTREEDAAVFVQQALEKMGIAQESQRFLSPKSAWRPFLVIFLLATAAFLLAPLIIPFSSGLSAVLTLLTVLWAVQELNLQNSLLRRFLPQGGSQNVIGRILPTGEPQHTIVLVAHLDSHRTPYILQTESRQRLFKRLVILAGCGLGINGIVFLLVAISGQGWLLWAALPFALIFALLAGICWQADRTPMSPGADDNASAVGVVLTMAETLAERPLKNTDIWILFSGAQEVGGYGLRAFLDTFGPALIKARFLHFDTVGHGLPAIIEREGVIFPKVYDLELIDMARRAAAAVWQEPAVRHAAAFSGAAVTQAAGFPSVTLQTGDQETGKTAVWQKMSDNLALIQKDTLGHAVLWGLETLERLD